jgi:hypothetical protein
MSLLGECSCCVPPLQAKVALFGGSKIFYALLTAESGKEAGDLSSVYLKGSFEKRWGLCQCLDSPWDVEGVS